ncbi:MAG: hypothetical protein WCO56_19850 [Verrucomicrobiota bacterium]
MGFFSKERWALFDCVTGSWSSVEKLPFEIGNATDVDLRLEGKEVTDRHCALVRLQENKRLALVKRDQSARVIFNGTPQEAVELAEGEYSLIIGSSFLLLRGGKDLDTWRDGLAADQWYMQQPGMDNWEGPWPLTELCQFSREANYPPGTIAMPGGANMGFFLEQILAATSPPTPQLSAPCDFPVPAPEKLAEADTNIFVSPVESSGELTCPTCWLHFDTGEIMHVAVHDSLRGDPILGAEAPLRFQATQFNNLGQALDAFRLPCTDMACPHCRRVLPPGFLHAPHHIFSIVGDAASGKSYYLSVLIKLLPERLYKDFKVVFQDADPAGNALLNEMKNTLFNASTPEQAMLAKTNLEGAMYERLPRYGRTVALPKPFIYATSLVHDSHNRCAVIFYDNAGEHFQPGRDSANSPGAQHVASSSGIFYLFDPFNSSEFRQRLPTQDDPQLEHPLQDQQDVLLSEMRVRVQRLRNLRADERVATPLAVLVGKCDAWLPLLGSEPLSNPIANGALDYAVLRQNSERVRELMKELAPMVVANAESFSSNVVYFPVSAFGHAPTKIAAGGIAPNPRLLKPIMVEIPSIWLLSQVVPNLVPAVNA